MSNVSEKRLTEAWQKAEAIDAMVEAAYETGNEFCGITPQWRGVLEGSWKLAMTTKKQAFLASTIEAIEKAYEDSKDLGVEKFIAEVEAEVA